MLIYIDGGFVQEDITLGGEHIREGLTCIVSVNVPNPEFEGQTQVRKTIAVVDSLLWQ